MIILEKAIMQNQNLPIFQDQYFLQKMIMKNENLLNKERQEELKMIHLIKNQKGKLVQKKEEPGKEIKRNNL